MATTADVLAEIAAYSTANGRPCPISHLTSKFGDDAPALVATLKQEGKVFGRRGRNGGLSPANPAAADAPADASADTTPADTIAAEFAALAEKLAAASDEGEAAVG